MIGPVKKGHKYAAIICDHKTNKPIKLFDSSASPEIEKWISENQPITFVTRDRAAAFKKILNKFPEIHQIADKFHIIQDLILYLKFSVLNLMKNTSALIIPKIQEKIELDSIEPRLKEHLIKIQRCHKLYLDGKNKNTIAEIEGISLPTVKHYLSFGKDELGVTTPSKLTTIFFQKNPSKENLKKLILPLKSIPKLLNIYLWYRDLSNIVSSGDSVLFRSILNHFKKAPIEFKMFLNGIQRDAKAILCGFKEKLTNALLEGTINRLKAIKRTMYGRAHLDLLEKKLLYKITYF